MSLGSTTFDHNYFSGLILFLAAVIMIPPLADKLEKKLNISMYGAIRFFVVFLLIVPGIAALPSNHTTVNNSNNTVAAFPSSVGGNDAIAVPSESTLVAKPTLTPTEQTKPYSASINLHGEKTNFVKGEDILFKLSAVNLITKPTMHVQIIIIPPPE